MANLLQNAKDWPFCFKTVSKENAGQTALVARTATGRISSMAANSLLFGSTGFVAKCGFKNKARRAYRAGLSLNRFYCMKLLYQYETCARKKKFLLPEKNCHKSYKIC
jgi:hypothetical protein